MGVVGQGRKTKRERQKERGRKKRVSEEGKVSGIPNIGECVRL